VRRLLRLKKSVLEELAKEIGIEVTDKDTKWTIVNKLNSTQKGAKIGAIIGASLGFLNAAGLHTKMAKKQLQTQKTRITRLRKATKDKLDELNELNELDKEQKIQANEATQTIKDIDATLQHIDVKLNNPNQLSAGFTSLTTLGLSGVGALIGAVSDRYSRRRMNINKLLRKARQKSRRSKH